MMKAIVTQSQLDMVFPDEINSYLGITDQIKEKLNSIGFVICLENCYVGEKVGRKDGRFEIPLNISNANKLPRRVAIRDVTQKDVVFWESFIGKNNIIYD